MSPLEAYETFIAIRNHFTTEHYHYFLYSGRVNVSPKSFVQNKSKNLFGKLARKHQIQTDLVRFVACNFAYSRDPDLWVDRLFDSEAEKNYLRHSKYDESSSYIFAQEIDKLGNIPEVIKVTAENSYPILLKEMITGKVALETVIILNSFIKFVPIWDEKIVDPYLWPVYKQKIIKFAPFVRFDKTTCASVLKAHCEKTSEHI